MVTSMKLSTALLSGLLLGLVIPSLAQADVPPPPGYVESCTVEAQGASVECTLCGDAYHGDVDACEKKHGPAGFQRRCRTSGASVWKEVWCKTSAAPPPAVPAEASDVKASTPAAPQTATKDVPPKGGCSVVATGSGDLSGAGWLVAVLCLGLAGSRRRCRR